MKENKADPIKAALEQLSDAIDIAFVSSAEHDHSIAGANIADSIFFPAEIVKRASKTLGLNEADTSMSDIEVPSKSVTDSGAAIASGL